MIIMMRKLEPFDILLPSPVMANVKKHELAIRSEILAILAEQTEQELSGISNRKRIQDLLRDGINKVLMEMERFGGIENVFFTTMVMQ